jgi:transposase-like protein
MRFEDTQDETLAAPNGGAKRTRFSAEMREQIRAELESGAKSVAQIAREYGPSHPTIMGWKREWGMTHPRPRRSPSNGSGAR